MTVNEFKLFASMPKQVLRSEIVVRNSGKMINNISRMVVKKRSPDRKTKVSFSKF